MKFQINRASILVYILVLAIMTGCTGIRSNPRYAPRDKGTASNNGGQSEETVTRTPRTRRQGPPPNLSAPEQFEYQLKVNINKYMGVPYRWGGSTSSGMDCSGFVTTVYRRAVDLAMPHDAEKMFTTGTPISRVNLQYGDLVFFENIENKGVSHVGIYVGESKFAHASTHRGVIVSGMDELYYKQRYIGARRVYTPDTTVIGR